MDVREAAGAADVAEAVVVAADAVAVAAGYGGGHRQRRRWWRTPPTILPTFATDSWIFTGRITGRLQLQSWRLFNL